MCQDANGPKEVEVSSLTKKIAAILRLNRKRYVEIIFCRVSTCRRAVLPKINDENATYPERCPGCRSKYYNQPYTQKDML